MRTQRDKHVSEEADADQQAKHIEAIQMDLDLKVKGYLFPKVNESVFQMNEQI